jgi:hypothetical protein
MSRFTRLPRWMLGTVLTALVGLVGAGCVAVPVGGYGYGGPSVVLPAPGVVVAPGPVYRHRHYGYRYRHYGRWRGW